MYCEEPDQNRQLMEDVQKPAKWKPDKRVILINLKNQQVCSVLLIRHNPVAVGLLNRDFGVDC